VGTVAWRDPGPILRACSVAIIGASPAARWVQIFLEQIPQAGFRGALWPVNPAYERIGDVPCFPSVRATPQVPEAEGVVAVNEDARARATVFHVRPPSLIGGTMA